MMMPPKLRTQPQHMHCHWLFAGSFYSPICYTLQCQLPERDLETSRERVQSKCGKALRRGEGLATAPQSDRHLPKTAIMNGASAAPYRISKCIAGDLDRQKSDKNSSLSGKNLQKLSSEPFHSSSIVSSIVSNCGIP